jgi:hypothetical protein
MDYINALIEDISKYTNQDEYFQSFKILRHQSGDVELLKDDANIECGFGWRFLHKSDGIEIDQLHAKIKLKKIEDYISTTIKDVDIKNQDYTLRNSSNSNRELFLKVCTSQINDEKSLFEITKKLIEYINIEIRTFLDSNSSIEKLGDFILDFDFPELINVGIGGEYPANILKAITVAKWCDNETKYLEYKKGLQEWIDEDRNDPNYTKMCDTYQKGLNQLIEKLENQS